MPKDDTFQLPDQIDALSFLADLDHGQVVAQLGEQLAKLARAVFETHGEGNLTLVIKIADDGGKAMIKPKSTLKLPTLPMYASLMHFDEKRGLTREDPKQAKLPFKDLPSAPIAPPRRLTNIADARPVAPPVPPPTQPRGDGEE